MCAFWTSARLQGDSSHFNQGGWGGDLIIGGNVQRTGQLMVSSAV